jgi:hypothetical protein
MPTGRSCTIVNLAEVRRQQSVADDRSPPALDTSATLHIRCGHDIMHKLAAAGFAGDFLAFGDPYVHGPVPRTPTLEEFVRVRAAHLEPQSPGRNVFDELYASYRDLEQAKNYSSVRIWMEHDSHDQLVLAKLLDFFAESASSPPRLRLVCLTQFPGVDPFIGLGQLPPEALRVVWHDFEDVSEAQLLLGKKVWDALIQPTPEGLMALARSGTPALPTMGTALARHLRELPSSRNGLSLTEQLTLEILAEKGPMPALQLFGCYTNEYEPLPFMGDTGYWAVLLGLAHAGEPAIAIEPDPGAWSRQAQVELLPFGERLLRHAVDWLHANTLQRWVGGVYIDSRRPSNWRFDEVQGVLRA